MNEFDKPVNEFDERRYAEYLHWRQEEMASDLGTLAIAAITAGTIKPHVNAFPQPERGETVSAPDQETLQFLGNKAIISAQIEPTPVDVQTTNFYRKNYSLAA